MSLRSDTQSLESKLSKRAGLGLRFSQRNQQRPLALPDFQKLAAVGAKRSFFDDITEQNIIQWKPKIDFPELEKRAQRVHNKLMQNSGDITRGTGPRSRPRNLPTPEKLHCDTIKLEVMAYVENRVSFQDARQEIERKYSEDPNMFWYRSCTS